MGKTQKYGKVFQVVVLSIAILFVGIGIQSALDAKAAVDKVVDLKFGNVYNDKPSDVGGIDYKFHLEESGQVQLPITHEKKLDIKVYNFAGTKVYEEILMYPDGDRSTDLVKLDLLAGDYTLNIAAMIVDSAECSFTPTFQASGETSSEKATQQNNDTNCATELQNINTKTTGQFAVNDTKDVYTFSLSKMQVLAFHVFSSVPKIRFIIQDTYGDYTYTSDTLTNGTYQTTLAIPEGTYYLTFLNESVKENGSNEWDMDTGLYEFSASEKDFPYTSIKSVKNNRGKKLKVNWVRNTMVSGYEIQLATNSSFSKNKKTITVPGKNVQTKTITNLKKKVYYVRVRTYMETEKTSEASTVNKKCYSDWSGYKKISIRK